MKLPNLKFKKNLILLLTLAFVFLLIGITKAQELQRTFTVINPSIVQKLNPGEHAEGTTKIINQSNVALTFQANVQDYVVNDTKGTPDILAPNTLNSKYSAAAWIGITPSLFTVKPGGTQTLNYYIQVPFNAKPGGHYSAIVYTPVINKTENQTGGSVNTQVGSLFYVTINGPVKESASVSKFFANSFQEYGPVKILTQIKNFGDLHIAPKGAITVSGLFFKNSQNLPDHNIFTQTARDFENSFGNTFMVGRYKAEFLGTYGTNNNLPLVATLYFWVFPWKITIIIVLIIVALVLLSQYMKKKKKTNPKSSSEPKKEDSKTSEEEAKTEAQNPETA